METRTGSGRFYSRFAVCAAAVLICCFAYAPRAAAEGGQATGTTPVFATGTAQSSGSVVIVAPVSATGTTEPAPAAATAAAAVEPASDSATDTIATKTLYQRFFEEEYSKCTGTEVTVESMDYMLKHFNQVTDGFLNTNIQNTIGCLALEKTDASVCGKFGLVPDSVREVFPVDTYDKACRERVGTLKAVKGAFSGGSCEDGLRAYCKDVGVCARKSEGGKICTCELYAALFCGIPASNSAQDCEAVGAGVAKLLEGNGAEAAALHANAATSMCQKAVLGVRPGESKRDVGASIMLFLGGLFKGAKWPIFAAEANLEDFGVPPEFSYWYDYTVKHKATCMKHLEIFKDNYCATYADIRAHEREMEEMKRLAEEKRKAEEKAKGAADGGDKGKADEKDKGKAKGKGGK